MDTKSTWLETASNTCDLCTIVLVTWTKEGAAAALVVPEGQGAKLLAQARKSKQFRRVMLLDIGAGVRELGFDGPVTGVGQAHETFLF